MTYEIEVRPAALRALRKIDRQDQRRIQGAIALLAADPRPPGAKALRGRDGLRIRVGNYRIIYTIQDAKLLVASSVGHLPGTSKIWASSPESRSQQEGLC